MPQLDAGTAPLTVGQREWLQARAYLQEHRHELSAVAAELYPGAVKVAGTPLLSAPSWLPADPVALDSISLEWRPGAGVPAINGAEQLTEHLRPERPDGSRYESYSAVMAELAAPRVFLNRSTYRLAQADLAGEHPRMAFQPGSYFDGVDVGEACAHELAAARMGLADGTPLRDAIGNPCDPSRRGTSIAISTLTLRLDEVTGEASFPLHWRDPAKVGHAGGLYMVLPVGVFQASGDQPWHVDNDFSLWRSMLREFAEELLGESEDYGDGRIDYDSWPFAARMTGALAAGRIRAQVLGLGVDALTLATDLLTVVTVPADVYDDVFAGAVDVNEEGRLARSDCAPDGRWLMTADCLQRLAAEPMQAAGAALVRLAWHGLRAG